MTSNHHDEDCDCEACDEMFHPEEVYSDPIDSCKACGCNIYRGDDVFDGLCDQCEWMRRNG